MDASFENQSYHYFIEPIIQPTIPYKIGQGTGP